MAEIKFKSDKKQRGRYFTAAHFSHPAKMSLPLQRWLILNYTKVGDTILDPMGGCGTILIACTMGRDIITVELEDKFVKMQRDNWKKIQVIGPELGFQMGTATILQGDARNLPEVLADVIVSSPPYAEAHNKGNLGVGDGDRKDLRDSSWLKDDNPDNISNLSYGKVDAIVTSPPYEGSIIDGNGNFEGLRKVKGDKASQKDKFRAFQFNKETTAYGKVDAVVTSPPYAQVDPFADKEFTPSHDATAFKEAEYAPSIGNIGNLKGETYLSAMKVVYENCHRVLKQRGLMCLVLKNFIRGKKIIRLDLDTIKIAEASGFELVERHYRKLVTQSFWRVIALQKCDHRKGGKDDPKCNLGLECSFKKAEQLSMLPTPEKKKLRIEKLCPSFINTSPEINQEDILIFRKVG